ncbi:ABC transporter ATP-binding protein [Actinomadura craniellae]|uniref:ABC transporter ATP-binding protein n=1 Tax=Actinomadura craniellae TaxID=2231787 RepID=A0A365H3G2_9ACTN|nr:ABC transporter ATP-binding protein [Actinomadura craniellae]
MYRTFADTARQRPGAVLRLALWSAVGAAPTFVFGHAVARAVDGFLAGRPAAACGWLGVLLLAGVAGALAFRPLYAALAAIVEPFRDDLVERVVRGALARSLTGRPDTGAVARLTHQVEIARDSYAGLLMVARGFLFSTAGALLGLLTLAPAMLLFVLPPLLLALVLFAALLALLAARQRALLLGEERLAERTAAVAEGVRDAVACGGEERLRAEVGEVVDEQAALARSMARLGALRALILALGGWGPLLLVLAAAPWLVERGAGPGTVAGALTYVMHGLRPALNTLVQGVGGGGLRLAVALERIAESGPPPAPALPPALPPTPSPTPSPTQPPALSPAPSPALPPTRPPTADPIPGRPAVELCGVTFSYGPRARAVLKDLDLVVPEGDHLAVVGPSGIGKSTLAALVAGTAVPSAGRVLVHGRPPGDPRHRVLIPQQAYVFGGSLHDNLGYLAPGADSAAMARAVDAVGLAALVKRLGGLGGMMDPGALSAGEAQLVALARAFLSPAPLVVLDEATCHLDPAAEARVERAFAARPGTLVVIAHRISSALRARRVLVLDGSAAVSGGHEELLAGSPLYRDLVGHWRSEPAGGLGDPDGVDPVARTDLPVDPR